MGSYLRKFFVAALYSFLAFSLFAVENTSVTQVMIPDEVYIGDRVQVVYTFRTNVELVRNTQKNSEIALDVSKLAFESISSKCSVVDATLINNESEYTLRLTLIPWQVGEINFPPINLLYVLNTTVTEDVFIVQILPITIQSIVEKTHTEKMRPPVPPIIIPGTVYMILGVIVLSLILLIVFFRVLLKYKDIKRKIKNFILSRGYRKNASLTLKKVKKLSKNVKLSDSDFSKELQLIVRSYLEYRFSYPFTAVSTSGLSDAFNKLFAGEIPEHIAYETEELRSMFIRTDYIRYAHDSLDSQLYPPSEHEAAFVKNERDSLLKMFVSVVNSFEDKNKKEESDV